MSPEGQTVDGGEVLEIDPLRKLVLRWRHEYKPEAQAEGDSRMTYQIETEGESVKLTVIHEIDLPDSKLIDQVSRGWPHILSSLKTMLETGAPLKETTEW